MEGLPHHATAARTMGERWAGREDLRNKWGRLERREIIEAGRRPKVAAMAVLTGARCGRCEQIDGRVGGVALGQRTHGVDGTRLVMLVAAEQCEAERWAAVLERRSTEARRNGEKWRGGGGA